MLANENLIESSVCSKLEACKYVVKKNIVKKLTLIKVSLQLPIDVTLPASLNYNRQFLNQVRTVDISLSLNKVAIVKVSETQNAGRITINS